MEEMYGSPEVTFAELFVRTIAHCCRWASGVKTSPQTSYQQG